MRISDEYTWYACGAESLASTYLLPSMYSTARKRTIDSGLVLLTPA